MQPYRAAAEGVNDMLKKAGDTATAVRNFIVGIFRRWAIYLPFTGAIESLRFWLKQKEIQAWMDSISESYHREMGEARLAGAARDEQEEIANRHHVDQKWAEDELHKLYHSCYVHAANRLRIPVPPCRRTAAHGWRVRSATAGTSRRKPWTRFAPKSARNEKHAGMSGWRGYLCSRWSSASSAPSPRL